MALVAPGGTLERTRREVRPSSDAKNGQLGRVRSEVSSPPKSKKSSTRSRSTKATNSRNPSSSSGSAWSWLGDDEPEEDDRPRRRESASQSSSVVSVGPTPVPVDWDHLAGFSRFPYDRGHPGYARRPSPHAKPRLFAGTVSLEGSYLYRGLSRGGFTLELYRWRVGLASNLDVLVEGGDALLLGSTNLTFSFVLFPRVHWRAGAGAQYLVDVPAGAPRPPPIAGINLSTTLDVFPVEPLVVDARVDYGRLGPVDSMVARGSAGIALGRVHLYGGYLLRRIRSLALHGPTAGVRVWF